MDICIKLLNIYYNVQILLRTVMIKIFIAVKKVMRLPRFVFLLAE